MFKNERKQNANTYLISNFDSLEAAPFKSTALGSCLVCLGLNSPLPGICLTTEEKAWKNLSQGSRRVPSGMMTAEHTEQNIHNTKNTAV